MLDNILIFCNEEKKITEIMEKFNYKNRTKFKRKFIQPLLEVEKLEMTIPEKTSSKYQKYKTKNKKE